MASTKRNAHPPPPPAMEFCSFSKIGHQHGSTEKLLKAAAFSTWNQLLSTKNKNY